LAALAIAIRSNVYAELKNPSNRFWNYDAATIGFEGTAPQRSCPRADRALEVTKNLVIVQPHSRGGGVLPAGWWDETSELGSGKNNYGGYLKLDQAEEMGMQGRNAAEILQRSFPQSHLQRLKSITR
ncbi:MAG: hypothetical protein KDK40_05500, partial [Chlamydiia bacterium]|nr:hypothetical protein [Chlamydiia bacterium]